MRYPENVRRIHVPLAVIGWIAACAVSAGFENTSHHPITGGEILGITHTHFESAQVPPIGIGLVPGSGKS